MKNTPNTEEFERCVMCGALTCVPVSMPIDRRDNYEIGCGQICAECAKKQQKATGRENTLTTAQILQAVEQSRKKPRNKRCRLSVINQPIPSPNRRNGLLLNRKTK